MDVARKAGALPIKNTMSQDIQTMMARLGENARQAGRRMAAASTAQKNQALLLLAQAIDQSKAAPYVSKLAC